MTMDHQNDLGFCPGCGSDVEVGAAFCRSCGRSLMDVDYSQMRQSPSSKKKGGRGRIAFFILAVVGIFLLWMGASVLMDPQTVIDEVVLELDEFGFGEEFAETFVMYYAYGMVVTAFLALAAGAFALVRRYWLASVVIALLVTLTTPFFIFSFPAVFALYLLWKGRDEFS